MSNKEITQSFYNLIQKVTSIPLPFFPYMVSDISHSPFSDRAVSFQSTIFSHFHSIHRQHDTTAYHIVPKPSILLNTLYLYFMLVNLDIEYFHSN